MMRRLRDPAEPADGEPPVMTELRRLACAVGDLEPPPGAQDRVRAAIAAHPDRRSNGALRRQPMLAVVLAAAIASVVVSSVLPASGQRIDVIPASTPDLPVVGSTTAAPAGPAEFDAPKCIVPAPIEAADVVAGAALTDTISLPDENVKRLPQCRFRDTASSAEPALQGPR
jgi:hypothetical protein